MNTSHKNLERVNGDFRKNEESGFMEESTFKSEGRLCPNLEKELDDFFKKLMQ